MIPAARSKCNDELTPQISPESEFLLMKDHNEQAADAGPTDNHPEQLTTAEILGWSEFACWTTLALAPVLYYVNGPSVSTDQAVVRTALVVLSAIGAVVLRGINWRRSRHGGPERGQPSADKVSTD